MNTPSRLTKRTGAAVSSFETAEPNHRIRIVVVDDQPLDRYGLVLLLETQPDFIVSAASSGREAIELCRDTVADVLVLDLRMPGMDGLSTLSEVHGQAPRTRILAVAERGEGRCLALNPPRHGEAWNLGHHGEPVADCLRIAVTRGAHGAIRRSAQPAELFQAVRALATGNAWYEAGTASRLREPLMVRTAETLSRRELEVAELIAQGLSNKQIGATLQISDRTVKKHVSHVLAKLGLDDRLQIGLFVARNPLFLESARSAMS